MNTDEDFVPDDGAPTIATRELTVKQPAALTTSSATAMALSTAAAVEARMRMQLAREFPRDIEMVERRLLGDMARPTFAKAAWFCRPVGKKKNEKTGEWEDAFAEGFSIRFAESALQALGNLDVVSMVIYEDDDKSILRVRAVDYETNGSWADEIEVPKTVERRQLRKGQKPIGTRVNSYGDTVYIVMASAQEHEVTRAAARSKKARDLVLRLLPADIKEACAAQRRATLEAELTGNKKQTVAKMVQAFAGLARPVSEVQLAAYLGHPVLDVTTEEYEELQAVWAGLREGATTWPEVLADRRGDIEKEAGEASVVDKLKTELQEKIASRKRGAAKAEPTASASATGTATATATEAAPVTTTTVREPGEEG